jgi:hypothetical protein
MIAARPTERKAPDRPALRTEARSLEFLLRNYLEDKAFLADQAGKILYFVDAHELKSYLDPGNPTHLQGFILEAERAQFARTMPNFELRMMLQNDQFLQSLLFDASRRVGILPSHLAEVEEEIAFRAGKVFRAQIRLLDQARKEVLKLRHAQQPKALRARMNNPDDKTVRRDLVRFFGENAPSLIAYLQPNPDENRLDALKERSNLAYVTDLDWKKFGFDDATCERLERLRPPEERVENWRSYLSTRPERTRNSSRANRIDGEAIAYLQALNEILSQSKGPRVRGCLVTRTMTLVNSVVELQPTNPTVGAANFIRHPRLLALRGASGNRAAEAETEQTLKVALQTYRRQFDAQRHGSDESVDRQSAPIGALVEAWHDFERARLTIELHTQAHDTNLNDEDLGDFRELLQWFSSDTDVATLVNNELRAAVSRFGHATFTLENAANTPIPARVSMLDHPKRARVVPMIAGAPGPVEFGAEAVRRQTSEPTDLMKILDDMDTVSAERYVGWSLLFACQKKWQLAEIYARSAVAIGEFGEKPSAGGGSRRSVDEAHLLLAQIQRLGGDAGLGGDEALAESSRDAERRYKYSMDLLGKFRAAGDPRWAREQAAQILELQLARLSAKQDRLEEPSIRSGITWIHTALETVQGGDAVLLSRILELGLTYHLAALEHPHIWSDRNETDMAVAREWHRKLHDVLKRQRGDPQVRSEEISLRARAMEIIGFRLLQAQEASTATSSTDIADNRGVWRNLLVFVRELRDEIKSSTDNCAKLITRTLDKIVPKRGQRDLVFAPIWASHQTEWIVKLIEEPAPAAARLAQSAYRKLSAVAGGSQKDPVDYAHRSYLTQIAEEFGEVRKILQRLALDGNETAKQALFYARMEICYTRLLLALIEEKNDRDRQLESLITEYQAIAQAYPEASIPHFRLDTIFSELRRDEEAFGELSKAFALIDSDPFLRTPGHWVRSTLQRRIASRFSSEVAQQRRKLAEQPDPELQASYLQNLLAAFHSVYSGTDELPIAELDYLYSLEARRRINNILYYASRLLEIYGTQEGFRKLGIEEGYMLRLVSQLIPEGDITKVLELWIIHTIGSAYAVLGEVELAAEAGNHLLNVAKETEDAKSLVDVLDDAFSWIQRQNATDNAGDAKSEKEDRIPEVVKAG